MNVGSLFVNGGRSRSGHETLSPLSENVENLLFRTHSHIRDTDGMHPEEALDEVAKLIKLKLSDEQATNRGKPYRFQCGLYSSSDELATELKRRFDDLSSNKGGEESIKLSSAALYKVVKELEKYSFTLSDTDIKGRAFQKMTSSLARAGMGQFLTPSPVVQFMVDAVKPSNGEYVVDPFSGSCHFLELSAKLMSQKKNSGQSLFGIEKNERMYRLGNLDMEMNGIDQANIIHKDSLLDFSSYTEVGADMFDVVLTNPPFGSLLSPEAMKKLGKFALAKTKGSTPLEIIGLERSIQLLKPGGRIGIVLPDGVLSNRSSRYVREWLLKTVSARAIVSLPISTFAPFGANVKTSILFARKLHDGEDVSGRSISFIVSENVGYDASGRLAGESDLDQALNHFRTYIDKEDW